VDPWAGLAAFPAAKLQISNHKSHISENKQQNSKTKSQAKDKIQKRKENNRQTLEQ